MNKALKIVLEVLLFIGIIALVYLIYSSIMKPVNFNKQKERREAVAIQRLKDIRTLQVAYKSVNGKFVSTIDSLKNFYENGKMAVVMQIGSADDSVAWAHTEKVKKANRKITPEKLYEMYQNGDNNLVFSIVTKIPVKDTLFNHREDFCVDSLAYIPFSGGEPTQMEAITRMVSPSSLSKTPSLPTARTFASTPSRPSPSPAAHLSKWPQRPTWYPEFPCPFSRPKCLTSSSSRAWTTSCASILTPTAKTRTNTRVCRLAALPLLTTTPVTGSRSGVYPCSRQFLQSGIGS